MRLKNKQHEVTFAASEPIAINFLESFYFIATGCAGKLLQTVANAAAITKMMMFIEMSNLFLESLLALRGDVKMSK